MLIGFGDPVLNSCTEPSYFFELFLMLNNFFRLPPIDLDFFKFSGSSKKIKIKFFKNFFW